MLKRTLLALLLSAPCLQAGIGASGTAAVCAMNIGNTITLTRNEGAGNTLVVAVVSVYLDEGVTSITDTGGSTYAQRAYKDYNGTCEKLELWSTCAGASLASRSLKVKLAATDGAVGCVSECTGVAALGNVGTASTDRTALSVTDTTQDANNWVVEGFGGLDRVTITANVGALRGTPIAAPVTNALAHNTCASPRSCRVAVTGGTSSNWTAVGLELRSAAGSPGGVGLPTLSGILPASGPTGGGTPVTINGTGFLAGVTITFGSAAATSVTVQSSTQITATAPAGPAGAVNVTVKNTNGQNASLGSGFTFVSPPTLSGISPASGPTGGGTAVTLTGTGFLAGATTVFGSAPAIAVTVVGPTQITATTPAGSAGAVNVVVTNPNGLSGTLTSGFTFQTPNSGSNLVCIPSGTLPDGNPLVPYHATLTCSAGTPPYTWSLLSGTLPSGLTFNPNTGLISGTPSEATEASFTAEVTDSSTPTPQTARIDVTLNIVTPGASDPELPQVFMDTTFPNTSGYISKTVCASGCNYATVQAALNAVHTVGGDTNGEIIKLASGATFTENDTLPAYTMAPGKWVIVTTNPSGYTPPAAGIRVESPNFIGMARIVTNNSSPAIQTASKANHYWFMGVEIGVANGTSIVYNVFAIGNGETTIGTLPNWIVIDRCYLTGNVAGANANNVARGVEMNGDYIAVINSYIDQMHQVGADAQAIASWSGGGPFEIDNNFLEGSTENILFGGSDPSIANLVPSDITITHNHLYKPLTWFSGSGSYGGVLWQVKNLLELKNAQRVLTEGNVLENNWAQAQNGYGVLFTPRNQNGTCPWCGVSNVTFRYNLFQHSGSGFNLSGADAPSPCGGGSGNSQTLSNVSIHDNLILDINGGNWGRADGNLFQILAGYYADSCTTQGPQNITINHNTGFQTGKMDNTGDYIVSPTIGDFVFENGILPHGGGFVGSSEADGIGTLNAYFTNPYVFMGNAMEAGSAASYPSGNFFPKNWAAVLFTDPTNCNAGTYAIAACALQSGSPYHNAGTDGKDVGANIDAIDAATAGVTP